MEEEVWQEYVEPHPIVAAVVVGLGWGLVFGLVDGLFALLEGDTSNGTDYVNMTIVYGSLLALPVAMFLLTRWQAE